MIPNQTSLLAMNHNKFDVKPEYKTILFESKFNVNIDDFKTTAEIDQIIEEKTGKKLKYNNHNSNLL